MPVALTLFNWHQANFFIAGARLELAVLQIGKQLNALLNPTETPSMTTFATIGTETLAALTRAHSIYAIASPPADASADEVAPIAMPEDLARLQACETEAKLVETFMPLLRNARFGGFRTDGADPCRLQLINGESHPWLDALHSPLPPNQLKKPDIFATAMPFWSGRQRGPFELEGKLAARILQLDGVVREIYEAKVGDGNLTPSDFGQLVDYHSRIRGDVRGMLFNARNFWLFESERDKPVRLFQGSLGSAGSRNALRRFFVEGQYEAPLVTLLRVLLLRLRAEPVRLNAYREDADIAGPAAYAATAASDAVAAAHPDVSAAAAAADTASSARKSSSGQSFLGAGADGRTFCVRLTDGSIRVLKVVVASVSATRVALESEFSLMSKAVAAGAPVAAVVENSLTLCVSESGQYLGGGYLLADVLAPVTSNRSTCAEIIASLKALHSAGFVHGDARLPNLMKHADGSLVWIDFRDSFIESDGGDSGLLTLSMRRDARTLVASMLGLAQIDVSVADDARFPRCVLLALANLTAGDDAGYDALATAMRRSVLTS